MTIFFTILFSVLAVSSDTQEVQQQLKSWGIESVQTNEVLIIEDSSSQNLFDLSYNLSYLVNSLDVILDNEDDDIAIEYIYENSDIIIQQEWFEEYLSLETEEQKRKAIELLLDSIEGE